MRMMNFSTPARLPFNKSMSHYRTTFHEIGIATDGFLNV